jgi:hypothetical protein
METGMADSETKRAIEKARKLLAMIQGATTDSEAAAASAALQRLLAHSGITMADIDVSVARDAEGAQPSRDTVYESKAGIPRWVSSLAAAVSKAYRCEAWLSSYESKTDVQRYVVYHGFFDPVYGTRPKTVSTVVFFGMPEDVAMAKQVFSATVGAAKNCWKEWSRQAKPCMESRGYEWRPAKYRLSYYEGFARGIADAYDELARTDECVALMVVKPEAVTKAVSRMRFGTHRYGYAAHDHGAYKSGHAAGYGVGMGDRVSATA